MEFTFEILSITLMLGIAHHMQLVLFTIQCCINPSIKGNACWPLWSGVMIHVVSEEQKGSLFIVSMPGTIS